MCAAATSGASSEAKARRPHTPAEYLRHDPEQTLLYRTVETQLPAFLTRHRTRPVPHFVAQELRAFLRCGVLAQGFLRLRCDDCKLERLVPFSCKRRGFCPSCGGRRMADTAAHLVDRVWPRVPVRQWVLTLPYPLRYQCAYDPKLTSEVLRAFLRALFAELRRRIRRHTGLRAQQCGAVTFLQRFGSAMNLNLHFHTLALEGAFVYEPDPNRRPEFIALAPPNGDDVARVLVGTARRLRRLVEQRLENADEDALARDEPLLAWLAQASLRTQIATGPEAGERWRRVGDRVVPTRANGSDESDDRGVARHREMSLHAEVAVPANDRERLERLCRYAARPPIAHDRLTELDDGSGRLALRLKTRWRDGTTHILMEPHDLIDRLVPLIPPPRAHQVRYHGILAPGASLRGSVVPQNPVVSAPASEQPTTSAKEGRDRGLPGARARRLRWAQLLQRVFAIDALRCPRCGATLRLLAVIVDQAVARAILDCIGSPARSPPQSEPPAQLEAEETSEADDAAPFDFDQSSPYQS